MELLYRCKLGGAPFISSQLQTVRLASVIRERQPFALGRLGVNEINGYLLYNGDAHPRWVRMEKDKVPKSLHVNVGVFPDNVDSYKRWGGDYHQMNQQCDLFAVYLNINELYYFRKYLDHKFELTRSWIIHPMLPNMNWVKAFEGKKILIISQNINAIKQQIVRRKDVWRGSGFMLPDADYSYIKPAFSPSVDPGNQSESWFAELARMKEEMNAANYDVALVAAGGYANFLAVHAKLAGKVGVNMGGALDPLFGIKTKRYVGGDNAMPNTYINGYWIDPLDEDKPQHAMSIEDGCYW